MKKWAFVSDFDGTISKKDFYHIVIEKYFPQGKTLYKEWKKEKILDIDFLQTVFTSIHQDKQQIARDIASIPIDEYVPALIKKIQENGGDVYILSAGTDYYIHPILEKYDIKNVQVYANRGMFKDNNIHLSLDKTAWSYSKRYGIDKSKVIKKLKDTYEKVYFAGDSEPDSHPAAYADLTFAKNDLIRLLKEQKIPCKAFDNFNDIEAFLRNANKIK